MSPSKHNSQLFKSVPKLKFGSFWNPTPGGAEERKAHLQETVISTLVAGMLPVIGSKSYTEDMSSSLSITSPASIVSTGRARAAGSAHSLLLAPEESR